MHNNAPLTKVIPVIFLGDQLDSRTLRGLRSCGGRALMASNLDGRGQLSSMQRAEWEGSMMLLRLFGFDLQGRMGPGRECLT